MHLFYVFRLSNPVTLKKSYLSTYLGYLEDSFSIQNIMTSSKITIFVSSPQIAYLMALFSNRKGQISITTYFTDR